MSEVCRHHAGFMVSGASRNDDSPAVPHVLCVACNVAFIGVPLRQSLPDAVSMARDAFIAGRDSEAIAILSDVFSVDAALTLDRVRSDKLRVALYEALEHWESLWTSDNNDSPPSRIAELRKVADE